MQLQKPDVPDFHYDSSSSINGASDVDEVHSSTGSASSAHQSSADRQSSEESETKRRLRNETTLIRTWKVTTLLAIVTVAAMVSTGCYKILREQERRDFETNFKLFAKSIEDSIEFHAKELFVSVKDMAERITRESKTQRETFPFVTVPLFEVLGKQTRETSGIEAMYWAPLINPKENGDDWVNYTHANHGWLEESRMVELQTSGKTWEEKGYDVGVFSPFVHEVEDSETQTIRRASIEDKWWQPIWQTSPPVIRSEMINFNLFSDEETRNTEGAANELRQGVLGRIHDYTSYSGVFTDKEQHHAFHTSLVQNVAGHDEGTHSGYSHPHVVLIQPIFEDIMDIENSKIVGHLHALITWDRYVVNLLPEGIKGINVVIRNSCGQVHQYEIIGNSAIYKGETDIHVNHGDGHGDEHGDEHGDHGYEGDHHDDDGHDDHHESHDHRKLSGGHDDHDDGHDDGHDDHGDGHGSAHGPDEHHDDNHRYVNLESRIFFDYFDDLSAARKTDGHCVYEMHVNPTEEFEAQYRSSVPTAMTVAVICTFSLIVLIFIVYDTFVARRNSKMINIVTRSTAIVSSLFPTNVHDRLFNEDADDAPNGKKRLKKFLSDGSQDIQMDQNDLGVYKTKPIADLFAETTVLFADICGFTAWSSTREPSQVFTLLETIYRAFDDIAKKRKVFKVETVGDCYVAVTGLPDPRKDHAILMCRFASDCLQQMHILTKKLEVTLGPDTSDLDMRFGLHSGPVTAGVLRGERSRFQLFGDTMNTASRIESNGKPGRIHISQETHGYLVAANKGHWATPREDMITAKGKGKLKTYWLDTHKATSKTAKSQVSDNSYAKEETSLSPNTDMMFDEKTTRLVSWTTDVLTSLLKKVVAYRRSVSEHIVDPIQHISIKRSDSCTVLEEVADRIFLPRYERCTKINVDEIVLDGHVEHQLQEYISAIATMYRHNPFHNFEHASHVTMSVVKLMSRIVAPDVDVKGAADDRESTLHDYTYGITSDPLTQFACVFSALIHDVDHTGVPNTQLIQENPTLAKYYKNKSVAEQHSVDLAWELLEDEAYTQLRGMIYQTECEKRRFRQLVVNSIMATDIMDKDLKEQRNARWERAFAEKTALNETPKETVDRKATIVIEHLIQASDVAHTMQHWHIYRKWNQRLFEELYLAFLAGRSQSDPSNGWYKSELGFFDFYIIPLAKKLKDCGVFGVSSDEYLNYAEKNRNEWEQRGREVVANMIEEIHMKYNNAKV